MSYIPTVSILTTVYNREKYLAECIESVQNGHYQDYEHIIVDDGSTDRSVEIVMKYAAADHRVRFYQNQVNLGDYPNRNKAASYANGKYIKYLDADDMHGRFMVDILVDAMEMFPEAGFALFDYGPHKPLFPILLHPNEAFEAHYSGKHSVFDRSPINVMMKKEAFDSVGGFSGKRMVGDFEMWHKLASKWSLTIVSGGPPGFYREHEEQEMSLHRSDPIWPFQYKLISLEQIQSESCPLSLEFKQKYVAEQRRKMARTILYALKKHGPVDTFRLRKASGWSWSQVLRYAFR